MVRRAACVSTWIACFALLFSAAARAADTDEADLKIQGEYAGELPTKDGKMNFGVQVIARGGGKFHLVAYHGGLPGAGWDKGEKIEADGETIDGVTVIKSDQGCAKIKDGVLTVTDGNDQEVGKLNRIERTSPTLNARPPAGAIVLFDGSTPEHFEKGQLTPDGLLKAGVTSKQKFQDFSLHLEFRTPFQPTASGQGRGNSGCYLQGRYEVQILDSFGLAGKNNECGGIYEIRDPDVNMCFPPMTWQTYDIDYTAARYDAAGNKTANARMTVKHNGVTIHENVELPRGTRAHPVKEGPEAGPIYLQDHGNPVVFRNIWLVEKKS
jgi:hypothetical protein